MSTATFSLVAICLSAPVLADQPGGNMTGFLDGAPTFWRIDAERSEYHFESEGIGTALRNSRLRRDFPFSL